MILDSGLLFGPPSISKDEVVPIAVEYHDPINSDAYQFFSDLVRWLVETSEMFEHLVFF